MSQSGGNSVLPQPGDRLQRAFAFRCQGNLADQSRVLLLPGFQPFNVGRNNMPGILCTRPFRTDKRSFQMHTGKLGIRHISRPVGIHLGQHPVNIRLGSGHGSGQHSSGSLRSMKPGDGLQ
ncbi:hypothetical protein D3C81_1807900 [compost metagenome]